MTKVEARKRAERILEPLTAWRHRCHEASLTLVRHGLGERVARGFCTKFVGQHSWVVLGRNCYDKRATIVDPTLWSYTSDIKGVWVGTLADGLHVPHKAGSIWDAGKPMPGKGPRITLTPRQPLSESARTFLGLIGPLDKVGWHRLAAMPVESWPAGEIFNAMEETPELKGVVSIDLLGMLTDRNPCGFYMREDRKDGGDKEKEKKQTSSRTTE